MPRLSSFSARALRAALVLVLLLGVSAPRQASAQTAGAAPYEVTWHARWDFTTGLDGLLTVTVSGKAGVLQVDTYPIPCRGTAEYQNGVVYFSAAEAGYIHCMLDVDGAVNASLATFPSLQLSAPTIPANFWVQAQLQLDDFGTAPLVIQPAGATSVRLERPTGQNSLQTTTASAGGAAVSHDDHPDHATWFRVRSEHNCMGGSATGCTVGHELSMLGRTSSMQQGVTGASSFHTGPTDLWIGFDPQTQKSFDGALDWLEIDPGTPGHDGP